MRNRPFVKLAVCLISMAALILQSCSESGIDRDKSRMKFLFCAIRPADVDRS